MMPKARRDTFCSKLLDLYGGHDARPQPETTPRLSSSSIHRHYRTTTEGVSAQTQVLAVAAPAECRIAVEIVVQPFERLFEMSAQ